MAAVEQVAAEHPGEYRYFAATVMIRRSLLMAFSACAVVPLCIGAYAAARVIGGFSGTLSLDQHPECALVFGAAVHGNELPGPGILRRVSAAADLYHAKRVQRLIFSGGKGSGDQQSEASVMRDVALDQRIPSDIIALEEKARSTWENIAYSAPLLRNCAGIVGVSDRYHLARIELIANRQGVTLSTYPADASFSQFFDWRNVMREIAGYVVYLLGYAG